MLKRLYHVPLYFIDCIVYQTHLFLLNKLIILKKLIEKQCVNLFHAYTVLSECQGD